MGHFLLLSRLFFAGPLSAVSNSSTNQSPVETPPSPCKKKVANFEIRGDLLYWVPEVCGLETNFGSGSNHHLNINGISITTSIETDVDPSFDWNVGYRMALEVQFDDNRWEIGGLWTDFQGSGYKTINKGKWKVKLDQIDIAALYGIFLNSCVILQPFIGLRGTSIFQKLFSQVDTEVVFSTLGTAIDTRTFQDHQQFYGLGPLFGLNVDWNLKYGFGFYGTMAFSLLYGNYHLQFNDTEVITPPANPTQVYSAIKKNMKAFDFNVDLALGIQWQYLIQNACYLTMKLGLENHKYFNQSRLGINYGNLSFSGGVFSLGLTF